MSFFFITAPRTIILVLVSAAAAALGVVALPATSVCTIPCFGTLLVAIKFLSDPLLILLLGPSTAAVVVLLVLVSVSKIQQLPLHKVIFYILVYGG